MPRQPDREPQDGEAPARSQESFSAQGLSALLEHLEREPDRDLARAFDRLLKPGAVVGRFELQREIGSGGFGVVFEARDVALGRSVAFKAIRPGRRTRQLDDMLLREAEAAARLQHENIVALYDFGRGETGPYLVLELLRGETLAARLARGPVTPAEALHVGIQVARALAHAHAAGLLHRDLKPSNVFLTASGGVKVLDLGLAHLFGDATGASGTPAYMAPEQWRSEPQDGRTDLFALGVVLFELLAGRRPFEVRDDRSTALDPGPEPRLEVKRLPPRLARLVERCIAKDPRKRPASARAVLEELLALQRAVESGGARRRTRVLGMGLAVALLALAAGGAAWWRLRGGAAPARVPVAVADFDDRTGEAGLEGLSSLLVTSLSQSQVLDVLPRSRMRDLLRAAGKQAVERIDEQLGREVGRLAGAHALLLATLYRFGEVFALEVRAVEPASDRELFSLKEQTRGKEGLPELLDRIAEGVRRALRESPRQIGESSVPVARAVTPNLEAWRHYFRGMECTDRASVARSYDDCLVDFRRAAELDPGFALAHYQTAYVYFWQGRSRAEQRAAFAPALRHQERATARDRQRIVAWAAFLDGRDAEAKRLLRAAAEAQPDDKYGWYLAGEIPFHRDEVAEAAPLFRRAYDLDPTWLMATQHLVYALGTLGRQDEIRALAQRLEELGARPGALVGRCYADLWIRPERSLDECTRAVAAGAGVVGSEFAAITLLNTGPPEALEAHLRTMAPAPGERNFAWYMTMFLRGQEGRRGDVVRAVQALKEPADGWLESGYAEAMLGLGDLDEAWRAAERLIALDPSLATNLAVHFAYAGDLEHAAALARFLPAASPRSAAYDAVVRWRRGDLAGAVRDLGTVAKVSPASMDPVIPFPLFLYGEALAEAGQHREAAAALERMLAMPRFAPTWTVPRALLTLAVSLERAGDTGGARTAATRLREMWKEADEGQPRLADARALWARLGVR